VHGRISQFKRAQKNSQGFEPVILIHLLKGEMLWSKLITKKLSCPKYGYGGEKGEMTCTMDMESYGHTADDYYYELKDGDKSFGAGCNFSRKSCFFNETFLTA
jgi:hypothetical protein